MNIERNKQIKYLLNRCTALKENCTRTMNDHATNENGRYCAFKAYASEYNELANDVVNSLKIDTNINHIKVFDIANMKGWEDTVWPHQRQVIEMVLIYNDLLIALLNNEIDFVEDECTNLENFIKTKLRSAVFETPEKEKDIQNTLEQLFLGKGWSKGCDYDRETGKFEFSGREYIPDFIIPKLGVCIEVKLLKDKNRKSKIIEEINADITAYSKAYSRLLFVVYDLGYIQNEIEFRRDIENTKDNIKVVIIKN